MLVSHHEEFSVHDVPGLITPDWESIEHHRKFTADPSYAKFTKRFDSFLNGRPTVYHATVDPPQPAATFSSPIVEMFTAYFPAATKAADKESWQQRFKKFLTIMPEAKGYKAHATGWVVEEVVHEGVEGKAIAWVTAVGWESVEAHMAFRETELFKKNVELLSEGPAAAEMHHLDFGALK